MVPADGNPEYRLDRVLAYGILRLTIGVNLFLHGTTRLFLGGLGKFVTGIVQQFQNTPLPAWQVQAFATVLPFVEATIGVLLIVGLWTRWTAVAGSLVMVSLIFGTGLRMDWSLLFLQMFYSFLYFVLLMYREYDYYSLDALITKKH